LFAVIGTNFGTGDGSTTFNLPDMRGEFVRGYDPGGVRDPEGVTRGLGKHQAATGIPNLYTYRSGSTVNILAGIGPESPANVTSATSTDGEISVQPVYGRLKEALEVVSASVPAQHRTRPTNINLLPCIRYR
jgi:microcystin-dependent protein